MATLTVFAALLVGPVLQTAEAAAATPTLHELAAAEGKFFGSATDNSELSDAAYTAVLGSEFGQITPGNSMKWDATEPARGQFSYARGDAVVDFAGQHGQSVRGHTLVWHSQLPSWVSSLPADQTRSAMETHIANVAGHYRGEVYAWDVVNEPFNEDGTFRSSPFHNAMGKEYVTYALRAARAADPDAKLYLNDYNIEGFGAKSDAMYDLARELKADGVPLDGIGFQAHLAVQYGFPDRMQENLQRFADLGLDVAITELDVRMRLPQDTAKYQTQIDYYGRVTQACMAVTRCVGITVWDYTDKYSWVPGTFSGEGNATPWDADLRPKTALLDAVRGALGHTGGDDTQPPSVPAGLRVTGTTSSSASLAWTASTDDIGVTAYDVYRDGVLVGSVSGITFTDSGLSAASTHSYRVRARDAASNASAQSAAVSATTSPGGTGGGNLKVQYRTSDTNATDNTVRMSLQLVNTGSSAQSLSGVEIRYWFADGASSYTTWCDWAQLGCSSLTHSVAANGSAPGADHYLKVNLSGGSLAAAASTGEIQLRVHKADWSNFNEADDYSRGTNTAFADAPTIGVYVNGTLAWGTQP
ncbi:endo-1,4-beta-xylanase [Streptomyces sp. NPDC048560]|uniref:endo-1,4-beta-xylanase n=1 Tax=Streptomyces sp. NPDC048560 TaxID=3155488 RepID=UPI00341B85AA